MSDAPYHACRCGQMVLSGTTAVGTVVTVDPQVLTYVVDWMAGTPTPRLMQSRGYPVHQCPLDTKETP